MKRASLNDLLKRQVFFRHYFVGKIVDLYIDILFWRVRFIEVRFNTSFEHKRGIIAYEPLSEEIWIATNEILIDAPKSRLNYYLKNDIEDLVTHPSQFSLNKHNSSFGSLPWLAKPFSSHEPISIQEIILGKNKDARCLMRWTDLCGLEVSSSEGEILSIRDGMLRQSDWFLEGFELKIDQLMDTISLAIKR